MYTCSAPYGTHAVLVWRHGGRRGALSILYTRSSLLVRHSRSGSARAPPIPPGLGTTAPRRTFSPRACPRGSGGRTAAGGSLPAGRGPRRRCPRRRCTWCVRGRGFGRAFGGGGMYGGFAVGAPGGGGCTGRRVLGGVYWAVGGALTGGPLSLWLPAARRRRRAARRPCASQRTCTNVQYIHCVCMVILYVCQGTSTHSLRLVRCTVSFMPKTAAYGMAAEGMSSPP